MKTATQKKVTKATFKSFVRRNREGLLIRTESRFDGMIDGTDFMDDPQFTKALDSDRDWGLDSTLGIHGIWLVGGGRDYFQRYESDTHEGISVSNCCGSYTVAIAK